MTPVVIDTNVLISWYKRGIVLKNQDLSHIAPSFSIITKIEALGFQDINKTEIGAINRMLNSGELVYIDSDIAERTIAIRQKHRIKTPDAIIAATAISNNSELWTANTSDFVNIEGLRLHNPLQ